MGYKDLEKQYQSEHEALEDVTKKITDKVRECDDLCCLKDKLQKNCDSQDKRIDKLNQLIKNEREKIQELKAENS